MKIAKTAHCGYLYEDGHAVVIHKERHAKAGEIEWVEVWEKFDFQCGFKGRIVFHDVVTDLRFKMACEAYLVSASTPSLNNGSDNTKKHGIECGYFRIANKDGTELHWNRTPGILSDGLTYQPDNTDTFAQIVDNGLVLWCGKRIAKVHRHDLHCTVVKEVAAI